MRTYYSEALRDYLLNRSDILGDTYQERYTRLYRGGLSIHTTLDPFIQARAEDARNQLPQNGVGVDAALTSVETATGAIRAMVGGRGFIPGEREVNLALAPSQTGSSIKLFVLAAALQAGATPDDIVDGTHPCTLPNPDDPAEPTFVIAGGVSGGVDTVRSHTVRSINCAYSRMAQMVGLNRMVDTVYRMASNPYLYLDQPTDERRALRPYAAFSIGANEMSTLDMAAGIQTIANEGVHIEPYYVEYIDDAEGNRIYTHVDAGTRVLDRDVALTAIDVLKGVNTDGTGRRELADFASRVPQFGKTGTQQSNWTAFYVGATRFLSTAVLVRDPNRYTEMEDIPEFLAAGVDNVQGGTFPARIWRTFMEQVGLEQLGANLDWEAPPAPARPPARLVLPGNECVFEIVGYEPAPTTPPPPSAPPAGDAVTENVAPPQPDSIEGFVAAPPTTVAPAPETTDTTTTAPPVPIYAPAPAGTTIPPNVLDPNAPLPSVPRDRVVRPC